MVKNPPNRTGNLGDVGSILESERPPGEMATHSSMLAWRIPWTEEPGGLWPVGLQRVGHNLATKHCYCYLY